MCGIAGIVDLNLKTVSEESIRSMIHKMNHRGPDDNGVFLKDNIGLGFVRLSILDLSTAGHQPMRSADGRFVIIYNGEIFNYVELRKELEKEGFVFKTNTDTEVLLNSYIHWGKSCLDKLNGMWAFVILDTKDNELFGARDRFGIKPFYYTFNESKFLFASEIPPILNSLNTKIEPNMDSIFDYLVFNRTDQNESTFFKNIFKIKHGHYFTFKNGKLSIRKWYDLKENIKKPFSNSTQYLDLFTNSIDLRLRSDVPIGICFSGGLDSSSILSLIQLKNKNINTFSAIYKEGESGDESRFINLYKNKVDNMNFIYPTGDTLFSDLNDLIETHAEPIPDTSPYAQYKVMQLAKNKVTVTLDGQGADEQLGGYHYFFGLYYKELFYKLKWLKLVNEIVAYKQNHTSNLGIKSFVYFLLPSRLRTKVQISRKGYLSQNFLDKNSGNSKVSESLYNSRSLKEGFLDHFEYKLEHLLKWEDRNSMRFSIEARVPFLDHRLVEKTLSMQNDMFISNGTTKVILREAMKGIIPEEIRTRQDKIGFGTPEAEWFRKDNFKELILEILNSESFKNRNIIDPEKAKKLYIKHLNKQLDISKEIWKWINLEIWFRKFIDQ
jgi:asparagine synthase (glutamine-hydrolysing)